MAIFRDAVITDAGKEATEKLIVSTGTLQFTGFAVGTGTYTKAEKEEAKNKKYKASVGEKRVGAA